MAIHTGTGSWAGGVVHGNRTTGCSENSGFGDKDLLEVAVTVHVASMTLIAAEGVGCVSGMWQVRCLGLVLEDPRRGISRCIAERPASGILLRREAVTSGAVCGERPGSTTVGMA